MRKVDFLNAMVQIANEKNYTVYDYEKNESVSIELSHLLSNQIDDEVRYLNGANESFILSLEKEVGGYEDGPRDMYIVFKLTDIRDKLNIKDYYIRFDGYYSSWNECYFYDVYLVNKVQIQEYQYERANK